LYEHILLEEEQEQLLQVLVEASRNVERAKRQQFMFVATFGGSSITHPGLPDGKVEAYKGDIETLAREGLSALRYGSHGSLFFDVTPLGFRYYEEIKGRLNQPAERVETAVRQYLDSTRFQHRYPGAYRKWTEAEALLWSSESESQFTTIGHLCREAVQEFAEALVQQQQVPDADPDKAHTVARIRSVLNSKKGQLGSREKPFLDALLTYWGTVGDLTQRQEHGGQKEGKPVVWEDARRVVFQCAVVMFEIDSAVSRA
jgi:hypothetical protein